MRAIVFTRPGTVELRDVDDPIPAAGETLVHVRAAGICGSELHGIANAQFRRPPLIMGHEFAGTIGDGARVTVNPLLSCGYCDLCLMGQDNLCRNRQILGIHRPGAFADFVNVPDRSLHALPDEMTFETAAMVEPLANAVHALNLAAAPQGSRIAVLGAGTIGLMALLVAQQFSSDVEVCDLAEERLDLARTLGSSRATAELHGEFDVIIDAVGAVATHRMSITSLRPGGTAVWIGLMSTDSAFDGQQVVREEKRVLGSYCYRASEFAEAVKLAGEVTMDWATAYPLKDGAAIFTELMNGRHDVVKALLRP